MDASASQKVDADIKDVCSFFFKVENTDFPRPLRQKNTVVKYTKLPEYDFDARGRWPRSSNTMEPRFRRIITLEDPEITTSRSLKSFPPVPPKAMTTNISKRKIVTISEDDEYDLHPKFSKDSTKSTMKQMANRSVVANLKDSTHSLCKTSRPAMSQKYVETRTSAKSHNAYDRKVVSNKSSNKSMNSNLNKGSSENFKPKSSCKDKDTIGSYKSVSRTSNISKAHVAPSESEKEMAIIRSKLYDSLKSYSPPRKTYEKPIPRPPIPDKSIPSFIKEKSKYKPHSRTIIHVPIEDKYQKHGESTRCIITSRATEASSKEEFSDDVEQYSTQLSNSDTYLLRDMNIGTDPLPRTADRTTETDIINPPEKCVKHVQTVLNNQVIESLDIPNVSLKTDKRESTGKNKSVDIQSVSLPDLNIPPCQIITNKNEKSFLDTHYCRSTSYVISKATLTYRTKQKINFHVVGNNDSTYSNQTPSPLAYPMSVVSVFKKESKTKDISNEISMEEKHKGESSKEFKNSINEIKSLDCSYFSNSNKLMKPSDIISTITVNNGLLQSEYVCEQFQRELNFIDSFFESLQYLESSSFTDKCFKDDKISALVNNSSLLGSELDVKSSEYDNFLSKFNNGANSDDTETIASKNLLLLNILIRDEQRRAKNLLFVLKRREDALKDFTKSQILYLESKKKQDNTDISALKKKQRGALLKLQHECGEMQRMRKALVTLSEKRKVALMKTKKDLELKIKNNVDVEQIILGKKKLKRSSAADRTSVPLKCFDLSSSGCEDSTTSRGSSETASSASDTAARLRPGAGVACLEKSIQTGDSISESKSADKCTDTAAEHFVVVDGGYLNILFQNLSLPQIFSGGKQYEVNEEALKNIVSSSNSQRRDDEIEIDRLMDQINNCDSVVGEKSSTPSTARSLVEEFDQYYKRLTEQEKSFDDESDIRSPPHETVDPVAVPVCEVSDVMVQVSAPSGGEVADISSTQTLVENNPLDKSSACDGLDEVKVPAVTSISPPGSPALDPEVPEPTPPVDAPQWITSEPTSKAIFESSSASSLCEMPSSLASLAAPVQTEAEELRRQQLAIEQEIKELEQQQSRLLVVREIPDKPPPPYTPPGDVKPKTPRAFRPDDAASDLIRRIITEPDTEVDNTDAFDVFTKDFCEDSRNRLKPERSDKPWDSCNLLPQKPPPDIEKVIETTSSGLIDVLAGVSPVVVSGVSSRRSDHIDDILFAEWQRIEPQWTSLHTDEALVKNQLFETIFQRILTETVDEYKDTVLQMSD